MDRTALLRREMDLKRAFVAAGGLLLAGPDPTGDGGVLPGFGDQREVELLVDAGFTPVEALHIATANGAQFLSQTATIGTLAPGKDADLVIVRGDPTARIADIENTDIVFKDGVGYDSKKLIDPPAAATASTDLCRPEMRDDVRNTFPLRLNTRCKPNVLS